MKALLIYPPLSLWERYSSDIGHAGGRQIPLGVYYLAAAVRQAGHDAVVIDAEAGGLTVSQLAANAREIEPDLVGISATTVAFPRAVETARAIKATLSGTFVVVGGPHVTALGAAVLSHREIDFAVFGEGEETLAELMTVLAGSGPLSAVRGVGFRDREGVTVNPPRPFLPDLDRIPFPAYDLIEDLAFYNPPPSNYKRQPVANIITSRGCPNQCTFCGHSVFGRTLRQRSPENIAAEIELLYRTRQVREIAFVDDTFTIHPERIVSLFEILAKKEIRFPWTCMSRINTVDEEILRFMQAHGCWHISFGIESGNEAILRRIKKNISLEAVRAVIQTCHRLGILTKGFFIIGHPGETAETIDETIRFALSLPLDDVIVTLNTPLPGTEQYETASRSGWPAPTDWSQYNMWNPVYVPEGLTAALLLEKQRAFYRRFYLRPRIMVRYAASFLSPAGWKRAGSLLRSLPFLFRAGRQRH